MISIYGWLHLSWSLSVLYTGRGNFYYLNYIPLLRTCQVTLRDGMGRDVGGGSGWGTHGWFMWMYGKNHYNIVIRFQLKLIKKKKKKKPLANAEDRKHLLDPWVRKIPWKRAWHPAPVFLPREFHGQRSLAGNSSYGHKEVDTTEAT